MSKYFICCEQCFETIGKIDTKSAKLWMDFCAMHLEKGEVLTLHPLDFEEIRTLEVLGFLVSTELEKTLAIRINGHMKTDEGEDFFCAKEGNHE